jgi:DNA-binding CsgD family transcriptional regulator
MTPTVCRLRYLRSITKFKDTAWTQEEETQLLQLIRGGLTVEEIAAELGRRPSSVQAIHQRLVVKQQLQSDKQRRHLAELAVFAMSSQQTHAERLNTLRAAILYLQTLEPDSTVEKYIFMMKMYMYALTQINF